MPLPQTGTTHYYAQVEVSYKVLAIKGLVVYNMVCIQILLTCRTVWPKVVIKRPRGMIALKRINVEKKLSFSL